MRPAIKIFSFVAIVFTSIVAMSFLNTELGYKKSFSFPYKQAGLTEREAAAHLLGRFTYGATPGDIDQLTKTGLENWFEQQLKGNLADDSLNNMLATYDAIKLSNEQVLKIFPRGPKVRRMAIADGVLNKDSVDANKKGYRDELKGYMEQKGLKPEKELFRQFINQKILRATYTNNQLREVMTDFWFNHFNVAIIKPSCAQFIPAYERDVIRPNVFENFNDLLIATAKSPAMLTFLDNFSSVGTNEGMKKPKGKAQGLNENYAREVMELHTLGVDGGYTQQDVTEAARVLTGWTIYPIDDYGPSGTMRKVIERIGESNLTAKGFVHEGDFLFTMNRHDTQEKTVLGKKFAANGGYSEGVDLLNMLAHHRSTANFICKKLAVRFVSDNPPQSLIDKMAKTFLSKNGDIKQVLITMATAPEFWAKDALREKTKSPFELAISSVRSLDADIKQPFQLNTWITKMGQKIYFYQAPTGFPDRAQYWINTGALLNRMNFGLALASQRIPGIKIDLAALNNHREPESAEAALTVYSKLLMPERNLNATIERLKPLLTDPNIDKKIEAAANKAKPSTDNNAMQQEDETMMANTGEGEMQEPRFNKKGKPKKNTDDVAMTTSFSNNTMLSQVVGIIIGSPEYQRR